MEAVDPNYIDIARWQAFVATREESIPFHHANWLTLFSQAYGMKVRIVALADEQEIHAALPFVESRKPWRTKRLVCLPFSDCVRPLARSDAAREQLARSLPGFLAKSYRTVVLKTDRPFSTSSPRSPLVRHELSVTAPFDRLRKAFPPSLNRNLRRAEENGLHFIVSENDEAMDIFYRLHLLTRRKLGVPVQPRSFFACLQRQIIGQQLGEIAMVKQRDRVLAAAIFLKFKKTVIYKYGASDPAMLAARPNDLLFYHAIRRASECGVERFDFGTSEIAQQGLRRFKSKWGANESPVFFEYLVGQPGVPLRGSSMVAAVAKKIIQLSPQLVCRGLGEALYKYSA